MKDEMKLFFPAFHTSKWLFSLHSLFVQCSGRKVTGRSSLGTPTPLAPSRLNTFLLSLRFPSAYSPFGLHFLSLPLAGGRSGGAQNPVSKHTQEKGWTKSQTRLSLSLSLSLSGLCAHTHTQTHEHREAISPRTHATGPLFSRRTQSSRKEGERKRKEERVGGGDGCVGLGMGPDLNSGGKKSWGRAG